MLAEVTEVLAKCAKAVDSRVRTPAFRFMKANDMHKTKTFLALLSLAALAGALVSCAETASVEEARSTYFAAVEGSDEDCEGWLEWCLDQGYPQAACEQRSEYCEEGRWVGGDRPEGDGSDDPCAEAARAAERACVEAGGTAEECREVGAQAYDDCAGD